MRSPFPRAFLLTAAALAIYEWVSGLAPSIWPLLAYAVVFWFLIKAIQHYFCWMELTALARNGTLDDYLNSGLSRADVALGVIYPAEIAEKLAVSGVLAWFLYTEVSGPLRVLLMIFIAMTLLSLRNPPSLFLPDVESYLRKRNPIALFFIGFAVVVPLLIWFAIVFPAIFVVGYANAYFAVGLRPDLVAVAGIILAWILHRWPLRKFLMWRLQRFYTRYESFDDLFERYIEQG